ncbi:MAG TPA: response regulator [Elusimicrobiales bacterium]|nr:response regulator [Elusimicrobiales bacterium]
MNKTLLVADDDRTFHRIVSRVFEGKGWQVDTAEDGMAAMERIAVRQPDIILLDLNMPRLGGRELLSRLRHNPRLAMIPIIVLSGDSGPAEQASQFGLGADDFIAKPFTAQDLLSRVEGAARRARRMLSANPLTLLPGGPAIEEEAGRRIAAGSPLAFFYIDIDNFKAYNDNYGYLNGDNAIKRTAALLESIQADFEEEDIFLGHVGGDDFVLMSAPERAEEIAGAIAAKFDLLAPGLYSREDRDRGYTVARDRAGGVREFPVMSLSLAVVTNEQRRLGHYAQIVDIAGELKKHLKGLAGRSGSVYQKDRRAD